MLSTFADDIALLDANTNYLAKNLKAPGEEAANMGFVVNKTKTTYMIDTRNNMKYRNITQFEGYERVEQFKYIGSVETKNNRMPTEIKA